MTECGRIKGYLLLRQGPVLPYDRSGVDIPFSVPVSKVFIPAIFGRPKSWNTLFDKGLWWVVQLRSSVGLAHRVKSGWRDREKG